MKSQPRKLRPDSTLAALLSQAIDLPDGHCLIIQDSTGQQGYSASSELAELCRRAGERARLVSPSDPAAAIKAALVSLQPPAGGVH